MIERRHLLKSIAGSFLLSKLAVLSNKVMANVASWPESAFSKSSPQTALQELFPGKVITPTDRIKIQMPVGAENGAIVPVTIKTDLQDVRSISLLGEKNPASLIAQFSFQGKGNGQFLRTRIKLAESSHVIVIVDSGGELCSAQKYIDVLKGGCD